MISIDTDQLSTTFLDQARRYIDRPDFMLALELDDTSAKLMQAAGFPLQKPALGARLHDFRKAVRNQQNDQLSGLFDEIKGML